MALEDLTPAVRVEEILDGSDIEPATRLEYFMKKAANEVPKPAGSSDAGKVVTVNSGGTAYELATPASGGGGAPLVQYYDGNINNKWGGTSRFRPRLSRLACDIDGNNNLTMIVMAVSHETYQALTEDYCIANLPGPDMNYPIAKADIFVKNDISPYSMTISAPASAFSSGDWVEPAETLSVSAFYYNPNIVELGQATGSPCLIMDINNLVYNEISG